MAFIALAMLLGLAMTGLGLKGDTESEGSSSSEKYTGTEGDDQFDAEAGNDLVIGQAGDDSLNGGEGSDWLLGSSGADTLLGGGGNDVIVGGSGADHIEAGDGSDFVEAADIVDTHRLETSAQTAESFADIDFLYDMTAGSDVSDDVSLDGGDDTVVAGSGDMISTGAGSDQISLGDWVEDGKPVIVRDFSSDEDVIIYTYDKQNDAPTIEIFHNPDEGQSEVRANGMTFAILNDALEAQLSNIRLITY